MGKDQDCVRARKMAGSAFGASANIVRVYARSQPSARWNNLGTHVSRHLRVKRANTHPYVFNGADMKESNGKWQDRG